ncbi:MAG TPA: DUF3108 domain-containing protein [Gemmatimonadaceae bacterium]|nr:DUF3108 domain-containing protein [Gemmatimonadaceae bacterium]
MHPTRLIPIAALLAAAACSGDKAARDTTQSTGAVGATAADSDSVRAGASTSTTVPNKAPKNDAPPPGSPPNSNAPQQTAPAAAGPTQPGAPTTGPTSPTTTPKKPDDEANGGGGGTATAALASLAPAPALAPAAARAPRPPLPFAPGERLVYDVKFGSIDVGDAVMEVAGVEAVRNAPAFHIRFNVKGGTFLYKVNDRYESWIDTTSLVSLRHWQSIDEGSYERERRYEISPERGVYRENEKPEQPTVAQPLDDGSFFFFLRTIPLEVGQTYSFNRYFKPDRNPVTVTVVRRERIKVPAGSFDAIVLHPTIKAKGVFGEGGRAEIWLADDSSRVMLQMKSKLKIGSLNLYLKKLTRGS